TAIPEAIANAVIAPAGWMVVAITRKNTTSVNIPKTTPRRSFTVAGGPWNFRVNPAKTVVIAGNEVSTPLIIGPSQSAAHVMRSSEAVATSTRAGISQSGAPAEVGCLGTRGRAAIVTSRRVTTQTNRVITDIETLWRSNTGKQNAAKARRLLPNHPSRE